MRASLIEKGIALPVLAFANLGQTTQSPSPPPPPPPPVPLPPPLPPPRNSSIKEVIYSNQSLAVPQNRDSQCQTSPSLRRPMELPSTSQQPIKEQPVKVIGHKIRQEEITVYYDEAPFYERFHIYQGYNPKDSYSIPVTFEPSALTMHDTDSKTYDSIQPSNTSTSSTEELFYSQEVTCDEVKKHCCYYIFCCGICCD